jgi:FkbM family methyltransferase
MRFPYVPHVRNALSFLTLCRGLGERVAMLRWLLRVAWLRARGHKEPAVTTLSIGGLRFTLDWAAAEHVPLREIIGRGEYWPSRAFRPSAAQTVVDVGANAGIFATVAGSWVGPLGRLVAVEPNPIVVGRLRRNLHQNGLDSRSVVIAAGLSDHEGRATLQVGANTATGTLASSSVDAGALHFEVIVRSLDAIADELNLQRVDLLKIDVEGSEIAVLDGAQGVLARCQRAVIEVSFPSDVDGVAERCRRAGFGRITDRAGGADSGTTLVYAERR